MGFEVPAPLAVGVIVADRCEELLQLSHALHRMIGLDGRFACADRSCEDLEGHLVGSGLGTDLALPLPQKVDHRLLVPEPGVDLPACHEHFLPSCWFKGKYRTWGWLNA